jgi:hypothetical protein
MRAHARSSFIPKAASAGVKLTASLRHSSLETTVRVLGADEKPQVAAISPAEAVTAAGGKQVAFSVRFDRPTPAGTTVAIQALPVEQWNTPPTSVSVPPNAQNVVFTLATAATVPLH